MSSQALYIKIKPENVALFRFLLESYDNLALFTVLERRTAILKILFVPNSLEAVLQALAEINQTVPITICFNTDHKQVNRLRKY